MHFIPNPVSIESSVLITFQYFFSLARNAPTVYSFGRTQSSNSILSFTFQTRTAPPTEIMLIRDGLNLTIDGSTIQLTQTITNRYSTYYNNILSIHDDPDNVIGDYTIVVGNSVGQVTSSTIYIEGRSS